MDRNQIQTGPGPKKMRHFGPVNPGPGDPWIPDSDHNNADFRRGISFGPEKQ